MSTTLKLYWDLSSPKSEERLLATSQLINALTHFQEQFSKNTPPSDGANAESILQNQCAQDVAYALKRLTRGLGSRRESSRIGFAVALTEVLTSLEFFPVQAFIELLIASTQTSAAMKRDEEKDMLFGRLFGIQAVIRAGYLRKSTTTIENFEQIFDTLMQLTEKRSWLSESCWWVAKEVLGEISTASWKNDAIQFLVKKMDSLEQWRPEIIPFTLELVNFAPDQKWEPILSPTWKHGDILHNKNAQTLAAVMKEVSDESNEVGELGSWTPQLNFSWDYIMNAILTQSKPNRITILDFWIKCVDEPLLGPSATHERKYWGFLVFQNLLPRLSLTDIPMIFTTNIIKTLMNHLSNQDRYLNKIAKKTVECIEDVASKSSVIASSLASHLLGQPGFQNFDNITKTKIVENLVAAMDAGGVEKYVDYLKEQFFFPNDLDKQHVSQRRKWATGQMVSLVRNGKIVKDAKWIHKVLQFFIVIGFFHAENIVPNSYYELSTSPSVPITEEIQEFCRNRLQPLLGDLISLHDPIDEKGEFWSFVAVNLFETLRTTKSVKCILEFDESEESSRSSAFVTIKKLKKPTNNSEHLKALEILFEFVYIYTFYEPETAISTIEELNECYKKMTSKRKLHDNDPKPVDVIVDILLSFLSQPSAALRTLSETVFAKICDMMSSTSLDVMVDILQKTASDDSEDVFEDGDEMEVDEDDGDTDENDENDEESEQDWETTEDDESESDDNGSVDAELKSKLTEALGEATLLKEGDASSDEELMNDEQMMQLDDKIAAIFRERKAEQVRKRTKKQELENLKLKVFGILGIFVKRNPDSPLILRLMPPLVQVLREQASVPQIYQGAKSLVSNILKRKSTKNIDVDLSMETFKSLFEVMKLSSGEVALICSNLALMLVKYLLASPKDVSSENAMSILSAYRNAIIEFLTLKKSTLDYRTFQDLIHRYPLLAWELKEAVLDTQQKSKLPVYKQLKAFNFFSDTFTRLQSSEYAEKHDDMISAIEPITRQLSIALQDSSLTSDRVKEFLKSVTPMIKITLKVDAGKAASLWKKDRSWTYALQTIMNNPRFKHSQAIQNLGKQILKLLTDVPEAVDGTKKRKADETEENGAKDDPRTKKVKDEKSKGKSKKNKKGKKEKGTTN